MKITATIAGQSYDVEFPGHNIAIPLVFDGPQPNTYSVPPATSATYAQDGWVGDVREGGSCNFETYTLTPHCNGTHTECVGHISGPRLSVDMEITDSLIPARLITITPQVGPPAVYDPPINPEDLVITGDLLREALADLPDECCKALVIRTLPNSQLKMARDYMQTPPPFLDHTAMQLIREKDVRHLLVDFASVDRLHDEGKLSSHHIFWSAAPDQQSLFSVEARRRSITEFVFVHNNLKDGQYLLNLQFAPFQADAAPSRPHLYSLHPTK